MAQLGLPINRLISTQVVLTAQAVQAAAINSLLILGTSDVIDTVQRIRAYDDLDEIAADFGTNVEEYLAAQVWFAQRPQPQSVYIGRWANAATSGKVVGGILSTADQVVTNFQFANGGFHINIDGQGSTNVTGINTQSDQTLTAVAARIQTAIRALGAGYTAVVVAWNGVYDHFTITSGTTGATSTVSFLTAPTTGDDLSVPLHMRSTVTDAYLVPGMALEDADDAVNVLESGWGRLWYGVVIPTADATDHQQVGAAIEAYTSPHFYGVTTQDNACLNSADTTNIAYVLKGLGLNKTCVQYSSSSPYAVISFLARILTTRWDGGNTAITTMWKQEPTILPEILNASEANALQGFNCNVYAEYQSGSAIIQYGVCSSGQYIDTVVGADAMSLDIQTELFNLLYTTPTKIPQTDPGVTMLINAAEHACIRYVTNGYLAPGIWNSSGFGALQQGMYVAKGFYCYAAPIATQSAADRAARKSPLIQIAAKAAGAIHTADVLITVNNP